MLTKPPIESPENTSPSSEKPSLKSIKDGSNNLAITGYNVEQGYSIGVFIPFVVIVFIDSGTNTT